VKFTSLSATVLLQELGINDSCRCVIATGSVGTPKGCGFSPKSMINSSGVPVTRQKLA
jgi:hypothetical protein